MKQPAAKSKGAAKKPMISGDCAWFSTNGRQWAPREASPDVSTIVRTDPDADAEKWAADLRAKWPHICADIFLEVTDPIDLRWYFDHRDFHLHGGQFLFKVLAKLAAENRETLIAFCNSWSVKNAASYGPYACTLPEMATQQLFAESDMERYGPYFLQRARTRMQSAWRSAAEEEVRRQTQAYLMSLNSTAMAQNAFTHNQSGDQIGNRSHFSNRQQHSDNSGRGKGFSRSKPVRGQNRNTGSGNETNSFNSPQPRASAPVLQRPRQGYPGPQQFEAPPMYFNGNMQPSMLSGHAVPHHGFTHAPPAGFPIAQGWVPHAGINPLGFANPNPLVMHASMQNGYYPQGQYIPGMLLYPGSNLHGSQSRSGSFANNQDPSYLSRHANWPVPRESDYGALELQRSSSGTTAIETSSTRSLSTVQDHSFEPWAPRRPSANQQGNTRRWSSGVHQPEEGNAFREQQEKVNRARTTSDVSVLHKGPGNRPRKQSGMKLGRFHIPQGPEFAHVRQVYVRTKDGHGGEDAVIDTIGAIASVMRNDMRDRYNNSNPSGNLHFRSSQDANKVLNEAMTLEKHGIEVSVPYKFYPPDSSMVKNPKTRKASREADRGSEHGRITLDGSSGPSKPNRRKLEGPFTAQDARSDVYNAPLRLPQHEALRPLESQPKPRIAAEVPKAPQHGTDKSQQNANSSKPRSEPTSSIIKTASTPQPIPLPVPELKTWAKIAAGSDKLPKSPLSEIQKTSDSRPVTKSNATDNSKQADRGLRSPDKKHDDPVDPKKLQMENTSQTLASDHKPEDDLSTGHVTVSSGSSSVTVIGSPMVITPTIQRKAIEAQAASKIPQAHALADALMTQSLKRSKGEHEKEPMTHEVKAQEALEAPSVNAQTKTSGGETGKRLASSAKATEEVKVVTKKKGNKRKTTHQLPADQTDSSWFEKAAPQSIEAGDLETSDKQPRLEERFEAEHDKTTSSKTSLSPPRTQATTKWDEDTTKDAGLPSNDSMVDLNSGSGSPTTAKPEESSNSSSLVSKPRNRSTTGEDKLAASRIAKSAKATWQKSIDGVKSLIAEQSDPYLQAGWSNEAMLIEAKLKAAQSKLDTADTPTGSINAKKRQKMNRVRSLATEAITDLSEDLAMLQSRIMAAAEMRQRGDSVRASPAVPTQSPESEAQVKPERSSTSYRMSRSSSPLMSPPERSVSNFVGLRRDFIELRHDLKEEDGKSWISKQDPKSLAAILDDMYDKKQKESACAAEQEARKDPLIQGLGGDTSVSRSPVQSKPAARFGEAGSDSESPLDSNEEQVEALAKFRPLSAQVAGQEATGLGISTVPPTTWASIVSRGIPAAGKSSSSTPALSVSSDSDRDKSANIGLKDDAGTAGKSPIVQTNDVDNESKIARAGEGQETKSPDQQRRGG